MFKRVKVVFVIFLFVLMSANAYASENRVKIPIGDSPIIGPNNAPVTMIKFIDYQ